MKCKECSNFLNKNDQFCTECGSKVVLDKVTGQSDSFSYRKDKFLLLKILSIIFNRKFLVGFLVFAVLSFLFFWFSILPKKQKSDCHYEAMRRGGSISTYDSFYKKCLRRKGF